MLEGKIFAATISIVYIKVKERNRERKKETMIPK